MDPLTPIQFLVIEELLRRPSEQTAGRDIRERLKRRRYGRSAPAFYQLMARMEDAGWVKGEYRAVRPDGVHEVRERVYKVEGKGVEAFNETRAFFAASCPEAAVGATA